MFNTKVFMVMDLLALASAMGMDGQASCACCWCQGSAKDAKEAFY